jgi:NAD(P)-dependent dehydrogenase (short-subunit alcohol dehydrogenase family)
VATPALEGKAALVTGGGSGIGLGCARALVRDGCSVTIMGRTEARLVEAVESLRQAAAAGAQVQHVVGDVAAEDAVSAAIERAAKPLGRLDIAVANAGAGAGGPIFATTLDAWRYTMDVNLTGTFLTLKHAGRRIAASGGGAIVAISSIAGSLTHRFMAPYCTSKAGVEMLVKVAADELGPLGVRCNAVAPGLVPTEMADPLVQDQAIVDDYIDQMPLRRLGRVDDIAEAVRYLVGSESGWVTGQVLAVDGGHTLRRGPRIETMMERFMGAEVLDGMDSRRFRPGR